MRHEKIGAGAGDTDPANFIASDALPYISNTPKREALQPQIQGCASISDWREILLQRGYFETVEVVTGELGPVHLLGDPAPRVMLGSRGGSTFVWVCNPVWGWDNLSREFLKAPSKSAERYAVELAGRLRAAAQRQMERHDKARAARLQELLERRGR